MNAIVSVRVTRARTHTLTFFHKSHTWQKRKYSYNFVVHGQRLARLLVLMIVAAHRELFFECCVTTVKPDHIVCHRAPPCRTLQRDVTRRYSFSLLAAEKQTH